MFIFVLLILKMTLLRLCHAVDEVLRSKRRLSWTPIENNMSNRLIIKLTGGVGNQQFQYEFGRVQSLRDSRALILDKRPYFLKNERILGREFALDQFHIVAAEPSATDALYIRAMNTRFLGRLVLAMSLPMCDHSV